VEKQPGVALSVMGPELPDVPRSTFALRAIADYLSAVRESSALERLLLTVGRDSLYRIPVRASLTSR
jgi:hypothetical protein